MDIHSGVASDPAVDDTLKYTVHGMSQECMVVEDPMRKCWGDEENSNSVGRKVALAERLELFEELVWFLVNLVTSPKQTRAETELTVPSTRLGMMMWLLRRLKLGVGVLGTP